MDLPVDQQIFEQLKKSNKILIVLPQILTADALASGLAFQRFLGKMGKEADLASTGQVPEQLRFLPGVNSLLSDIQSSKSLVISVDTSVKKLAEISYETGATQARIFLRGEDQMFTAEDLHFLQEGFEADTIVTLDAASLEHLGGLFERHADLFFETVKINIDNKPANEYFGAINLVEVTASSVAEILAGLFEKLDVSLIDQDIATALLAGIITKTNSFQDVHTTPQAFMRASQLVALGGRQQEVIQHIYKTKPLPLLKIWGRALARLKVLEANFCAYSVLGLADFEKAESSPEELPHILMELQDSMQPYKILGLIAEVAERRYRILVAVHTQINAEKLLERLGEGAITEQSSGLYKLVDITLVSESIALAEAKFANAVKGL